MPTQSTTVPSVTVPSVSIASICTSGIPGNPALDRLGIVASTGMKDPPFESLTC